MASVAQWVAGARPRTLPAAFAPVLAGTGIAAAQDSADWLLAILCLLVATALQIGVNYANDYSDGIRGTDDERVGPMRLVGSKLVAPKWVKLAALLWFGCAALAGLAVVAISWQWWLIGVGAAAIAAAWFYTGGTHPYGYLGLGEVFVFIFFGLVAVGGTVFVMTDQVPITGWLTAVSMGIMASAILVANNLRDLDSDKALGKATLATRLGDRATRALFVGGLVVAFVLLGIVALLISPWALLSLIGIIPAATACKKVRGGANGFDLVAVLQLTGVAELFAGAGLFVGGLV